MTKFDLPSQINPNGPVVLIYEDRGGKASPGQDEVHVAIAFKTRKQAKEYKESIIPGKDAKMKILPLRAK